MFYINKTLPNYFILLFSVLLYLTSIKNHINEIKANFFIETYIFGYVVKSVGTYYLVIF